MTNNNLENTNGENSDYIDRYVRSIFDHVVDTVCPYTKKELVTEEIKENLINYTIRIFKLFYEDYKRENENASVRDVFRYLNHGHFSFAFNIGDSVIKIGFSSWDKRDKPLETSHTLNTYLNERINIGKNLYFTVSASPLVKVREFDTEETYGVYKGIRDDGYIWNDAKSDNLGILIKDKPVIINGVEYPALKPGQKIGDIVAIDLDDMTDIRGDSEDIIDVIYDEICFTAYNQNTYKFETRYRQEEINKRQ